MLGQGWQRAVGRPARDCGLAIIEELSGIRTSMGDPGAATAAALRPSWDLGRDVQDAIAAIVEHQRRYWRL